MFWLGLALGLIVAAGVGWLFWNRKAKIQAELEDLKSRVGA